jgi:hypothetical protein
VGSRWQKKWVVLTETSLAYYNSKGDTDPKVFILLETTTVQRLTKDLGFSVTNDTLFKGKHVGYEKVIEFQSASEENLSEWLYPLGALAGVKAGESKQQDWTSDAKATATATGVTAENKKGVDEVILAGYLKKVIVLM